MSGGKKILVESLAQLVGFLLAVLLIEWGLLGVGSGRWFGPWGFGG